MDKALDEVIGERQRDTRDRGGRTRRRDDWPRGNARKNGNDRSNIDDDWIHDKYEDENEGHGPRRYAHGRSNRSHNSSDRDLTEQGAKLRVENLHYELTEEDLEDLFERIAPVTNLTLTYDRAGRSTGTAYVTYRSINSARSAIREFDGANANGQPIRLSLVPSGPSTRGGRNPFDSVSKPGRSLFDRIDNAGRGRNRSRSPRRSDVSKPPPEGIDRYVPGNRSRSPNRHRRSERGEGRNGSRRGEDNRRNQARKTEAGRQLIQGRPKMTVEELDKAMDEYWNNKKEDDGNSTEAQSASAANAPLVTPVADDDIDMIE